jgi:hypothetical protein
MSAASKRASKAAAQAAQNSSSAADAAAAATALVTSATAAAPAPSRHGVIDFYREGAAGDLELLIIDMVTKGHVARASSELAVQQAEELLILIDERWRSTTSFTSARAAADVLEALPDLLAEQPQLEAARKELIKYCTGCRPLMDAARARIREVNATLRRGMSLWASLVQQLEELEKRYDPASAKMLAALQPWQQRYADKVEPKFHRLVHDASNEFFGRAIEGMRVAAEQAMTLDRTRKVSRVLAQDVNEFTGGSSGLETVLCARVPKAMRIFTEQTDAVSYIATQLRPVLQRVLDLPLAEYQAAETEVRDLFEACQEVLITLHSRPGFLTEEETT